MTNGWPSFRDPAGSCFQVNHRVLRVLQAANAAECEAFLESAPGRESIQRGQVVGTRRLDPAQSAEIITAVQLPASLAHSSGLAVFEHDRIPFPSYAYEWPPEMLWQAGHLTLTLARSSLAAGFGLKDATPYNVLYRGSTPVFIDLPSFERRDPGDPVWLAYGQFVRTFLLPLLVNRYWGLPLPDLFTTHRDGLEPEHVYPWCAWHQRLRPPFLSLVSLPTWLRGKAKADQPTLYQPKRLADPEKARFILDSLLRQLERTLARLKPTARNASAWSSYMHTHTYAEPAFVAKEEFVRRWLEEFHPAHVLDAGANTGHFSELAARSGASVVSVDQDAACIGSLWERAVRDRLDILPLVVDLSRPSPAIGWDNRESASFLDRARGHFDCVLLLAIFHHLLVTERVPLSEIMRWAASLTTDTVLFEFVPPQDSMFRQLTRGREELHADLTQEVFETACAEHFELVRSTALPDSGRRLYGLRRKGGGR